MTARHVNTTRQADKKTQLSIHETQGPFTSLYNIQAVLQHTHTMTDRPP